MKVQAAEQMFESGSSLLWMDVHGGVIFLVSDKGFWRGWPDRWDGREVDLPDMDPPVERGFAYLVHSANLLPAIGMPIWKERPYQATCEELADGWVVTDSYGRRLELRRPDMAWHVAFWPVMRKPEWI